MQTSKNGYPVIEDMEVDVVGSANKSKTEPEKQTFTSLTLKLSDPRVVPVTIKSLETGLEETQLQSREVVFRANCDKTMAPEAFAEVMRAPFHSRLKVTVEVRPYNHPSKDGKYQEIGMKPFILDAKITHVPAAQAV